MGVKCNPKREGCRCGKCLDMNDHWEAKYLWIRDPNDLPNNKMSAFGMLKTTEKRLLRTTKHAEMYSLQIQDMVKRGVVVKLTQEVIDKHKGPAFYRSYHETFKPDSESILCRIILIHLANSKSMFSTIIGQRDQTCLATCWEL